MDTSVLDRRLDGSEGGVTWPLDGARGIGGMFSADPDKDRGRDGGVVVDPMVDDRRDAGLAGPPAATRLRKVAADSSEMAGGVVRPPLLSECVLECKEPADVASVRSSVGEDAGAADEEGVPGLDGGRLLAKAAACDAAIKDTRLELAEAAAAGVELRGVEVPEDDDAAAGAAGDMVDVGRPPGPRDEGREADGGVVEAGPLPSG